MSTMLMDFQHNITDSLGLTDKVQRENEEWAARTQQSNTSALDRAIDSASANRRFDDYGLTGGSDTIENGTNVSALDRSFNQSVDPNYQKDVVENGMNVSALDRSIANAQVDQANAMSTEEEGSWKDWIPDASWDKLGQAQVGARAPNPRGGGGYRHRAGAGAEGFYNFAGNMTNAADPLNSQLGQRIAGKQKQLLGL